MNIEYIVSLSSVYVRRRYDLNQVIEERMLEGAYLSKWFQDLSNHSVKITSFKSSSSTGGPEITVGHRTISDQITISLTKCSNGR